jgi:hypothetical protein
MFADTLYEIKKEKVYDLAVFRTWIGDTLSSLCDPAAGQ